ncbi:LysM peptidoglycan-binding domain-containing protein [Nocardioides sp.]|uniref:LysM peptidoglycan-binding domain-containing protein n=1 Tax=Nocardioides sp. TaxID=35761 RepID=UPI0035631753
MSTITMTSPTTTTMAWSASAPRRPGQVRLTRRGRLAVFVLALLVVLTIGIAIASVSAATDEAGTPEPTRVVMVGTGETLWGIASEVAGDGDVREMVGRIERLNALETTMVQAGQRLRVPLQQ